MALVEVQLKQISQTSCPTLFSVELADQQANVLSKTKSSKETRTVSTSIGSSAQEVSKP